MLRFTKWAIWLYIILLMFEGALRKWVVPSLSTPLLIIRDPVLFLIYGMAIISGIIPRTKFLLVVAGLALASFCFAFLAGQNNLFVTLFGIRCNYLHLPLIWVMAEAFTRKDVENVGVFFLFMAIAMTALMIVQFKAPIESWINRGIGEDEMGQIYGAAGHIRPPGFFTFITGPMVFFPLATAFFLNALSAGKQNWWRIALLIVSGFAIAIALPISISRGTMIGTLVVLAVYVLGLMKTGILNLSFLRFGAMGVLLLVALSFLPIFKEARVVFMDRWDTAAAEVQGDAVGSLVSRVLIAFSQPIDTIERTPTFGYGIGVGTNAGAAMLAGRTGFLLAEDEWGRVIMELGPVLGLCFIALRFSLVVYLGAIAVRALWNNNDMLPVLIFSAAAWVILMNQWGQPTQLGFAMVGGGLLLASLNRSQEDDDDEESDEADNDEDDKSDDEDDEEDDSDDDEIEEEEPEKKTSEYEARRRRLRGL
jgi:hypothetical protein